MKRILIFNDCFYMGGTEILLVNLLNHLVNEKDCKVTLLLPNPSPRNVLLEKVSSKVIVEYIYPQELKGIKKTLYKNIQIFFPSVYRKLTGLKFDNYDLVVCFKDCFYSIFLSRLKLSKIIWIHNQPFERDYTGNSFREKLAFLLNRFHIDKMNRSFDKYNEVICVSDSCKNGYVKLYHNNSPKRGIRVLYNALDLSGIAKRAEEPVDIKPFDVPSFVVVIRLSPEKTVDRAILSTNKLRAEGYDFKMLILGEGGEFNNLQTMIKYYKLDDRISMLGRIANPFPYMKMCDWLLCPSSRESFSLVLLEAISLGTPVITTDCGGPEDVIERGKYGVFTENSEEGVYRAMKKVLDDRSLRDYYISKADECLLRFDYSGWITEVDKLFEI